VASQQRLVTFLEAVVAEAQSDPLLAGFYRFDWQSFRSSVDQEQRSQKEQDTWLQIKRRLRRLRLQKRWVCIQKPMPAVDLQDQGTHPLTVLALLASVDDTVWFDRLVAHFQVGFEPGSWQSRAVGFGLWRWVQARQSCPERWTLETTFHPYHQSTFVGLVERAAQQLLLPELTPGFADLDQLLAQRLGDLVELSDTERQWAEQLMHALGAYQEMRKRRRRA